MAFSSSMTKRDYSSHSSRLCLIFSLTSLLSSACGQPGDEVGQASQLTAPPSGANISTGGKGDDLEIETTLIEHSYDEIQAICG